MAIDRATDDAGSGGDVAHSGVGVLSQHIEGDVEDAIACLVRRAHAGGLGGHDTIVPHQCAMKKTAHQCATESCAVLRSSGEEKKAMTAPTPPTSPLVRPFTISTPHSQLDAVTHRLPTTP